MNSDDVRRLALALPEAIEPVPSYWGRKGATFVDCAAVDEATIVTLLDIAWRKVAPKSPRGA